MSRPYISIVAIARNEEKVVERFVKSIREYLGENTEIVIVDTGSKDNTVSLARSLGVKVYEEGERFAHIVTEEEANYINAQFNDEVIKIGQRLFFYSDARNCADSHATGVWCFSLDLHWVLTSGKELEKKLKNLNSNISTCSYAVNLGKSTFSTTRIYRRGSGLWRFRIHEIFEPFSGTAIGIKEISASKISGDPHGYLPHLAYHYYFGNYNKSGNEYARMLFYYAREVYYNHTKYRSLALKLLVECCHNKANWIKERSQAAIFISDLENDLDLKRKQLIWSITLNPIWREPYLRLADIAYKQCDWSGCIAYAEQALKIAGQEGPLHIEGDKNYSSEPYRFIYISLIQMARVCRQAGYFQRAIDRVEEALKIESKLELSNESFINLWREGYRNYKQLNNRQRMLKMFELCREADPEKYSKEENM